MINAAQGKECLPQRIPADPWKYTQSRPKAINLQPFSNQSYFSPTTTPAFISAPVIRAPPNLPNVIISVMQVYVCQPTWSDDWCTKTGGWCIHVQEHSPAGQPQESPQLQPVQSPREWAGRLAFVMCKRLQKILRIGLAYPFLRGFGKGYEVWMVWYGWYLCLDFESGSVRIRWL